MDPIAQGELRALEHLQRVAWESHLAASERANELTRRFKAGAEVEDGDLYFDVELKMARSRKKTGAR